MHQHHIIPRHMGGSDDPTNLVRLSIEEHAEEHRKLFETHNKIEDYYAWQGLLGVIPKAEILRGLQSYYGSLPKSEEHKAKIRKSNKEHDWSWRAGEGNPMFGRKHTDEAKKTISLKMMGKSACRWITNDIENKYIMKDLPTPDGWRNGRTMKTGIDGRVIKGIN